MKIYIVRKCGGEYSNYWDMPVASFLTETQAKCCIMQLRSEYKKVYNYINNSKESIVEEWQEMNYPDFNMPEEIKSWCNENIPYLVELCGYPSFGYCDYDSFRMEDTELYGI